MGGSKNKKKNTYFEFFRNSNDMLTKFETRIQKDKIKTLAILKNIF